MHLFAGVGGGLLADRILGHSPIVAVEWEPYACQVLRERAKEGWFPDLRVWEGDVRLFDPSEYAGKVDCIHAGFPCQDISVAGKQAGVGEETRSGLYREVLRIACTVRPRYLFLENVAAIVTNGLGTVLADLAALGFDAEWLCLRASACGANHHRDRWWLLANSNSNKWSTSFMGQDTKADWRDNACRLCKTLPNAGLSGICKRWKPEDVGEDVQFTRGIQCDGLSRIIQQKTEILGDTNSPQCQGNERTIGNGTEYPDIGGVGWWEIEPDLGRVANGVPNRVHRLKGLGNAQVPLQAAVAWKLLGGP